MQIHKRNSHSKRASNVAVNRRYKRVILSACRIPNRAARRAVARIQVVAVAASVDTVLPS